MQKLFKNAFFLLIFFQIYFTKSSIEVSKLYYNKSKFILKSDQEDLTFQEKLKQIDLKDKDKIEIKSQNENFFTFIQKGNAKSISIQFDEGCLYPVFLIDVYKEEVDPIYLIDQKTLTIEQISYANKPFQSILPGETKTFDIENYQDYKDQLNTQDFMFGEGDYFGIIFCPYFVEKQTTFSFKLTQQEFIYSQLEISNFQEDLIKAGTFTNEFTLSLKPKTSHFVKLTNINDSFSIIFDQNQQDVKIILEYIFNDQNYTSVFDKEPIYFYNLKDLNLLLKNNKDIPVTVNVTLSKNSQKLVPVSKQQENHHLKKLFLVFFMIFSTIVALFFACKIKKLKKQESMEKTKSDQDAQSLEKQKSLEIEKYFTSKYSFFHDSQELDTNDLYSIRQLNQFMKM